MSTSEESLQEEIPQPIPLRLNTPPPGLAIGRLNTPIPTHKPVPYSPYWAIEGQRAVRGNIVKIADSLIDPTPTIMAAAETGESSTAKGLLVSDTAEGSTKNEGSSKKKGDSGKKKGHKKRGSGSKSPKGSGGGAGKKKKGKGKGKKKKDLCTIL